MWIFPEGSERIIIQIPDDIFPSSFRTKSLRQQRAWIHAGLIK